MRTRMAAGEDSACALHAITEYDILWVANVVIKFGTRNGLHPKIRTVNKNPSCCRIRTTTGGIRYAKTIYKN